MRSHCPHAVLALFICLVLAAVADVSAQEYSVRGRIVDDKKVPLAGANIRLVNAEDTSEAIRAVAGEDGGFSVYRVKAGAYRLEVSEIGRKSVSVPVQVRGNLDLGVLSLGTQPVTIPEVLVNGRMPVAVQSGDTTEYKAAAVKINRDATAEDLITKMPGITVNNGTISAGGETVQRVLVDGRPFFGDDPTLAVRNLPAEVIDKIQVFDQASDQAQFTGFDDGQSIKALNIVTRRDRGDLRFGKFTGGYGENERYETGGNLNLFDGNRRISFLGLSNNINEQNFSTQDLLGVVSTNSLMQSPGSGGRGGRGGGGGRGGRRGGNPFGRSGGTSSSLVGQQQGINTTNMLGTNMSDTLSPGLFAQGSYFFNRVDNENDQVDHRLYQLGGDSTSIYDQTSKPTSKNFNHRLNSRIDYLADPSNMITVLPVLYFQTNRSDNLLDAVTSQTSGGTRAQNATDAYNSGYTLSAHAILRHKFDLPGRTISLDFGVGTNNKQTDGLLSALNSYTGAGAPPDSVVAQHSLYDSHVNNFSANLVYTEPTSLNGMVQLFYNPSFTRNTADKQTFDFDSAAGVYSTPDLPLTDSYVNDYLTQNAGIGYHWRTATMNLASSVSFQRADLSGNDNTIASADLSRSFNTVMPSALFLFTMPDHRSLRIYYRTSTAAPSVSQLQEVVNNSNSLLLTTGNPALVQSYSHTLLARYSLTSTDRAQSLFLLLSGVYTRNYIANSTYLADRDTVLYGTSLTPGTQLTVPVNLDGYWNVRTFLTYGFPFDLLSSALNTNAGITWSRTPGMLNEVENMVRATTFSAGFVLGSNVSEDFDFTISYTGNLTTSRSSINPDSLASSYSHTASIKWVWTIIRGIVLRNDVSNAFVGGQAQGFNQNIILWNISIAKKFFDDDKGELKAGVSDLLGQNQSLVHTVTGTYIDDTRNEVLARYAMLNFTYTLR